MAWFNKNNDGLGAGDYLRATDSVSRPLAVVFIIFIILAIAAIITSLFLGGRWLYRNLDGSNKPSTSITATPSDGAAQTVQPSTPTPGANSGTTSPNTSQSQQSPSNPTANTNTTTSSTPVATPSTGATPEPTTSLPNTGPLPE